MSHANAAADRNLLFGILAVQMDFVGRDALINAMHAWVLDKNRPLGQILLEQGSMAPECLPLLDALVNQHIKQHSDDVQASLASTGLPADVRDSLDRLGDGSVQHSLSLLTSAEPARGDDCATRLTTTDAAPQPGVRYRVLRPHAKGGLGQVSIALDEELHREVALKEIQDRHADNVNSRARFLLEAEITGRLEHPGIVPVYGLGTYADGRPYYAMKLIRGESFKKAIDNFHETDALSNDPGTRSFGLRQLLGRFVAVCNAMAYAHSRGVLHRDLKPGNIMLGQYGETLVVDWGLAKLVDRPDGEQAPLEGTLLPKAGSNSTPTQVGAAIGTPQYMSPEQAAGQLDRLGPAADVYSLGATLYQLLTGHAPFDGTDLGMVLQQVQRGDFRPPSERLPGVPAALEAICLKAMALRTEDRYASARELADDIEHWLADESVSALPDGPGDRIWRWVRHRSTFIAWVGLMLLIDCFMVGVYFTSAVFYYPEPMLVVLSAFAGAVFVAICFSQLIALAAGLIGAALGLASGLFFDRWRVRPFFKAFATPVFFIGLPIGYVLAVSVVAFSELLSNVEPDLRDRSLPLLGLLHVGMGSGLALGTFAGLVRSAIQKRKHALRSAVQGAVFGMVIGTVVGLVAALVYRWTGAL